MNSIKIHPIGKIIDTATTYLHISTVDVCGRDRNCFFIVTISIFFSTCECHILDFSYIILATSETIIKVHGCTLSSGRSVFNSQVFQNAAFTATVKSKQPISISCCSRSFNNSFFSYTLDSKFFVKNDAFIRFKFMRSCSNSNSVSASCACHSSLEVTIIFSLSICSGNSSDDHRRIRRSKCNSLVTATYWNKPIMNSDRDRIATGRRCCGAICTFNIAGISINFINTD